MCRSDPKFRTALITEENTAMIYGNQCRIFSWSSCCFVGQWAVWQDMNEKQVESKKGHSRMTSMSTAKKEQWNFQAPLILAHLLIQTHRLQEDLGKVINHCKANASVMQTECKFSCFTVAPIWICLWKILAHGHHRFPPNFLSPCLLADLTSFLLDVWRSDRT